MARYNPTIHDIIEQTRLAGEVPAEFAAPVQTSARRGKRRGRVKVPKIGDWRRTPKERGLKQGYMWKPPEAWRPSSGHFYIFPAPNKRSQGATRFFYVTDGSQVLSTQHRTKSEAVKALKGILTGAEAKLRVNPLTRAETGEVRARGQAWAEGAERQFGEPARSYFQGHADEDDAIARMYGPPRRPNPAGSRPHSLFDFETGRAVPASGASHDPELATFSQFDFETGKVTPAKATPAAHVGQKAISSLTPHEKAEAAMRGKARQNPGDVVDVAGELVTDVYGENPLTFMEVEEVNTLADEAEKAKESRPWPDSMYYRGKEDAYSHVAGEFDEAVRTPEGARKKTLRPRKKAKRKRKRPNPLATLAESKAKFIHKSIRPQHQFVRFRYAPLSHADPEDARKALRKIGKRRLPAKARILMGKFKESVKRGRPKGKRGDYLAWGIKTILLPKKGGRRKNPLKPRPIMRKAKPGAMERLGARVSKKAAKKKTTKKKQPKRTNPRRAGVCKFTIALERGKHGAKCTISYPKGIFKNREEALRNIQKELRAKFKQLKKAPAITSCTWRFTDKGKTRGRWHFTAKKAA